MVDHKDLNTVFTCNPTAENMAEFFYEVFNARYHPLLFAVEVSETPKTMARYERG
jgi:6-pyruvoyltetrahydropterin/6-carboxytetrahydropterin synthase